MCLNKIKVTDKTRKEQRIFFYIGERGKVINFLALTLFLYKTLLICDRVWVFGNREENEYIFSVGWDGGEDVPFYDSQ